LQGLRNSLHGLLSLGQSVGSYLGAGRHIANRKRSCGGFRGCRCDAVDLSDVHVQPVCDFKDCRDPRMDTGGNLV
jgi:hypothetical protein